MVDDEKPVQSYEPKKTPEPEWPSHVLRRPCCPPVDAVPVNCRIYRRIAGTTDDWKSYDELGIVVKSKSKLCQSTSLSCYKSLEALREILAVHESWSKTIVCADLIAEHGVIKQTNLDPNHYSLWMRRKYHATCAQLFVPVAT